jgi:hypothetical protein
VAGIDVILSLSLYLLPLYRRCVFLEDFYQK